MAITLAEASKNVQNALQMGVIDEFRKSSYILDSMTFDDVVSPVGGGATMAYSYARLKTQPTAAFRAVNSEYTPQSTEKELFTTTLKAFGGAFEIDRIIANMGGIVSEVTLQTEQKVKAARALFNDTFINGDSGVDTNAFDGLDKALTGSSTEYNTAGSLDLSTSEMVTANYAYFLDMIDEFLSGLDGEPSFISGNTKLISKIRACARRSSMYNTELNAFGQQVEKYGNTVLVDMGAKAGSNNPVVSVNGTTGMTSLYAGRLGLDGLHGVSMAGVAPVQIWLPNFKDAGAVKKGEVEMVAAIALKASKAAGVFRNIKVQ
jgi:hypothetical protein